MSDVPTHVMLTLRNYQKHIPYKPADRQEGSRCHGFIPLKSDPDAVRQIPEAADEPVLLEALQMINRPSTPFFSVGCEKAFNVSDSLFWAKGYIEISFNNLAAASDVQALFLLFCDFNCAIWDSDFSLPVQFHWEIERAWFSVVNAGGFTAAIWLTTANLPTAEQSKTVWTQSVRFLAQFLSCVDPCEGPTIY